MSKTTETESTMAEVIAVLKRAAARELQEALAAVKKGARPDSRQYAGLREIQKGARLAEDASIVKRARAFEARYRERVQKGDKPADALSRLAAEDAPGYSAYSECIARGL